MKPDDKIRLQHMLDAAQEAVTFFNSLNGENIGNNRLVSYAIIRLIEVVGEAATQISKEYKNSHQELPWAQIVGMRNRIVHAYFDIDYSLVESTVKHDFPALIKQLEKLIASYKEDG
ncbi:MAG: DUF86 domain-containing protein [Smithella sp.]|jgi:uncharacterized protein with HEPN domain|nr:DUF86 domain-containing protein [Smithella sp.]